jgi:phage-related protein
MTDTFIWKTETTGTGEHNASVFEAKFGDGYSQAVANGLNAVAQTRTAVVSGYAAELQPIVDFLRAHVGQSFYWTPPFSSEPGLYRCKVWRDRSNGGGHWTLEMEFVEVFAP